MVRVKEEEKRETEEMEVMGWELHQEDMAVVGVEEQVVEEGWVQEKVVEEKAVEELAKEEVEMVLEE